MNMDKKMVSILGMVIVFTLATTSVMLPVSAQPPQSGTITMTVKYFDTKKPAGGVLVELYGDVGFGPVLIRSSTTEPDGKVSFNNLQLDGEYMYKVWYGDGNTIPYPNIAGYNGINLKRNGSASIKITLP